MKLRFLCAHHHTWLRENPEALHRSWLHSYDLALELEESGETVAALRQAGCAFETAGLMLDAFPGGSALDSERFCESGALLVRLLFRVGEREAAHEVLAAAVARLERLLTQGGSRRSVLEACRRLLRVGDELRAPVPRVTGGDEVTAGRSRQVH